MSKNYISCNKLDALFGEYDDDDQNWVITEVIEKLCQGLTDVNIMMVEMRENEDLERLKTINSGIVSALRELKQLKKEVAAIIENGEVLVQGSNRKKGGAE